MRLVPFVFALVLLAVQTPALAGQRRVTYYLDGVRVEQQVAAAKGYLEYPLPGPFTAGSLRVRPLGGGAILRVEVAPAALSPRQSRELALLKKQRTELKDRLELLTRREEIFAAAVKSQSGKAPRASKSNPDPVASLNQGTDFALARLDGVSRARKSCERSLESVERRLAIQEKTGQVARVWLTAPRAAVSYLASDAHWTPSYLFRWAGDKSGELLLHARIPAPGKGVTLLVSAGTVSQGAAPREVSGEFPLLARYPLMLVKGGRGDSRPLSFSFEKVAAELPPGEAAAFWGGEYLGRGRFAGGTSCEVAIVE
ncbi:DUF4140 domain-containing protein [Geomonas sp. Red32]|uniref:DUF4140 domain-containing protein n=1 Tax=Geomonas sp. Red32 TaxID=2912856 RepID=UPI00202CBFB6|nr:DUF4140 domain-containing protein [Geomonas sp. Red32]MCM0084505.1 DUF4140 domain-containing protein [Geomonas sp. Red32]